MAIFVRPNPHAPPPAPKVIRLFWGALLVAQLMFVYVAFSQTALSSGLEPPPSIPDQSIPMLFGLVAAIIWIAQSKLPLLIARHSLSRETDNKFKIFPEATRHLFAGLIVRFALCEAIVLLGFAAATVAMNPQLVLPFALVGILTHLKNFPSDENLKRFLERALN